MNLDGTLASVNLNLLKGGGKNGGGGERGFFGGACNILGYTTG